MSETKKLDYSAHMRRAGLHKILAIATQMLENGIDNSRLGYKLNIEDMRTALDELKWNRPYDADDKHSQWEWSQ